MTVVGIISGAITAVSPWVLPVLPALLTSSLQDGVANTRRPFVVVGGLATCFAALTRVGGALISFLHPPGDVLRWAGILTRAAVGLGLTVPSVGHVLERPFVNTRLPNSARAATGLSWEAGWGACLCRAQGQPCDARRGCSEAASHFEIGANPMAYGPALGGDSPLSTLEALQNRLL
jgi:cytochrome c biogenesis protein CcdA